MPNLTQDTVEARFSISAKGLEKFVRYIENVDITNLNAEKQPKCSLYRGTVNNCYAALTSISGSE